MNSNNTNISNYLKSDIFKIISEASDKLSVETYVVGGYVRDMILKRDLKKDIDIMCVGSGIELAEYILAISKQGLNANADFRTLKIEAVFRKFVERSTNKSSASK